MYAVLIIQEYGAEAQTLWPQKSKEITHEKYLENAISCI